MALGYLTWLWISPSHRNTGKLLPFTLSLSHTQIYLALSPPAFVYCGSFIPTPAQCLSPNYGHIVSPPLSV